MLIASLFYSARTFIESVWAMLATILAAITTFEQILCSEDNIAFFGIVKVVRVKFRSPEIVVHFVHICKINKTNRFKLWIGLL